MLYYLDTEFNGFGGELISLALVPKDPEMGSLYLALNDESIAKLKLDPWVKDNVIPIIDVKGAYSHRINPEDFAREIANYLRGDDEIAIMSDWPDDIRYFMGAIITGPGKMVKLDNVCTWFCRVDAYPTTLKGCVQHNALCDARALREMAA